MPQTFTLSRKSNVNMSEWVQSDVNFALNDNLIDDAVLGWDYTQNISRLQFCSLAVKLAEELTEKSIKPADANTFVNTSDDRHGWKVVTIDGKNYYVDVTADDTTYDIIGSGSYGNFLADAVSFSKWGYKFDDNDNCTGTTYNKYSLFREGTLPV